MKKAQRCPETMRKETLGPFKKYLKNDPPEKK